MKNKERIIYIVTGLIVALVTSTITAYAATSYLYNADEVSYDKTNSELTSVNVQNAIDELYTKATQYTTLTNKISTLEGYFKNSPSSYFYENGIELNASSNAGTYAYVDFHYNGSSADYTSRIIEPASGKLNLVASNGVQVSGSPVFTTQTFNSSTVTLASQNATTFNINTAKTGYKPVGILKLQSNHGSITMLNYYYSTDFNTLYVWCFNNSSSSNSFLVSVTIAYAREELFK